MELRVLGPFEAVVDGRPLPLGGARQRALLALLALDANRALPVDRIVDELWGERAPATAQKTVQVYVSRLRKVLPAGALETRGSGYRLAVEPEALDLDRFERLRAAGRNALEEGRHADAARDLRAALGLWRGAPLAEFDEPFARPERLRLEELQLACLEDRIEADLALGRHGDLVGELESLAGRQPLRERLRGQLMLALYRSGRQAEALAAYRAFRELLDRELGMEPSAPLRELERRMLRQDPELDAPREAPPAAPAPEIRHARNGDVGIAYEVVGDGPVDLVLVNGWVCTFAPGWEDDRIARFYRGLASIGRLILFDKRGTGLSDRVSPDRLPDLETRMDDVRAVMDAAGSERAVLIGVSEGGPMSMLFAASHPERTAALVLLGTFARLLRAPDHPFGISEEELARRLVATESEDWARQVTAEWLARVAPGLEPDGDRAAWYTTYVMRGASPAGAKALRLMNAQIDVRHVLPAIAVPTLVAFREREWFADRSRFVGAQVPGAQVVELPGDDHLPWEGDQDGVLDAVARFVAETHVEAAPDRVLVTLLVADLGRGRAGEGRDAVVRAQLARFRGREVERAGGGVLATFDGPARAVRCASALVRALRPLGLEVRAGVHTGEVEQTGGRIRGVAVEVAEGVAAAARPGEVLVSQTVRDLVAGSGLELDDRGTRELDGVPGEWRLLSARDPLTPRAAPAR